jgi:hypothetical protein
MTLGPFFKNFILSLPELVPHNFSHPVQVNHDMERPIILSGDVAHVVGPPLLGMESHGLARMSHRSKFFNWALQALAFAMHDSLNVPPVVREPPHSWGRDIHPSKFTVRLIVNQIADSGDQSSYPFHGAAALGVCAEMWTRAPP